MSASINWLDLTSTDRDKIRRVLDLFKEQGTVDELGLGNLRDALSDALFPGTSVLHTRLRYVLFIPWIYRQLEQKGVSGDIAGAVRQREIDLISVLADGNNEGVIGVLARESLARLPSSVYWAALSRWGIFVPRQSQNWYHAHFDELRRHRRTEISADDPGVQLSSKLTWHPRLPHPHEEFPKDVTFALSREEAEFIQAQIRANCAGSLLAFLADHPPDNLSEVLWEEPRALNAPQAIKDVLALARQFSLVMEGAPLLYNLMLAEKRGEANQSESDMELAQSYREEIAEWMERAMAELQVFRPDVLWAFVNQQQVRCPERQRLFVERWLQLVCHGDVEKLLVDRDLRSLIASRERNLKGAHRARLENLGRLSDWGGRVGVGRMEFRWTQVRRLLLDLYKGLAA